MGNCCGKSENEAAFQGEGRTLNATPATAPPGSNSGRSAAKPKVGGPGRTLGSSPVGSGQHTTPGEAAARAAEVCIDQRLPSSNVAETIPIQRICADR